MKQNKKQGHSSGRGRLPVQGKKKHNSETKLTRNCHKHEGDNLTLVTCMQRLKGKKN